MDRFEQQRRVPGFGTAGQQRLRQSSVMVVGAGGLGCPVLAYLAAAGVGTLCIADGDVVALSNLNRQILYGEADAGLPKAATAAGKLSASYPDLCLVPYNEYLTTANVTDRLNGMDLVIDGSDNFDTRYLVSDACASLGIPYLFGAVQGDEGQLALLDNRHPGGAGYRGLFPPAAGGSLSADCETGGMIGVLPGIIGLLMAGEAVKFLSGYGTVQTNRLLMYNLQTHSLYAADLDAVVHTTPIHP
jgi:molybdopterin/thiamine biosynthesis adenylyltransferase